MIYHKLVLLEDGGKVKPTDTHLCVKCAARGNKEELASRPCIDWNKTLWRYDSSDDTWRNAATGKRVSQEECKKRCPTSNTDTEAIHAYLDWLYEGIEGAKWH